MLVITTAVIADIHNNYVSVVQRVRGCRTAGFGAHAPGAAALPPLLLQTAPSFHPLFSVKQTHT